MKPLKFTKKVLANIEKCYAVCPISLRGIPGFLVATEKAGGCFFYDLEGSLVEQIWSEPGGIMSLVPLPGVDSQFLSTQEFYSPNDSANSRIVHASPRPDGWDVRTLAALPFVHRFDILSTPQANYLIACTLKSDHHFKEDWTHPGKVFAARLSEPFDPDAPLEFETLMDGLTKNHGYYRGSEEGHPFALVSSDNGIFKFTPPSAQDPEWQIEKLLDLAASDALLVDLDGDGAKELLTLSPFHGDRLAIYHLKDGAYELQYLYPEDLEFLHAIWGGKLFGQPLAILGHRKGARDLFLLAYDPDQKTYIRETIDSDIGPANITVIEHQGKYLLISANRETDELAMYTITQG